MRSNPKEHEAALVITCTAIMSLPPEDRLAVLAYAVATVMHETVKPEGHQEMLRWMDRATRSAMPSVKRGHRG